MNTFTCECGTVTHSLEVHKANCAYLLNNEIKALVRQLAELHAPVAFPIEEKHATYRHGWNKGWDDAMAQVALENEVLPALNNLD